MKIALITGASTGLGRLFARDIQKHYSLDELWVVARSEDKLRSIQEETTLPAKVFALDLTKRESAEVIRSALKEALPTVCILINASGYGKFDCFDRIGEEDNLGMLDLNCRALTQITELCLPYMAAGSMIVNIASVAGFMPMPYGAVYSASKAYVLALTRALNLELKPKKIRALAVCPYWTKTAFIDRSNDNGVVRKFGKVYRPEFIVKRSFRAMKKKKEVLVPGFYAKGAHLASKLFPRGLCMKALSGMIKPRKEHANND